MLGNCSSQSVTRTPIICSIRNNVFIAKSVIQSQLQSSVQDYIKASLMLQYNERLTLNLHWPIYRPLQMLINKAL